MSQNLINDALTVLEDGAAAKTASGAGQVSDSAKELDVGSARLPVDAAVEIDVTDIDTTDGDETYNIAVEGTNTAGFGSTVVKLAEVEVTAVGKYVVPVNNEQASTIYQYLREYHTLAGTTPSITFTARLSVR